MHYTCASESIPARPWDPSPRVQSVGGRASNVVGAPRNFLVFGSLPLSTIRCTRVLGDGGVARQGRLIRTARP